jgi:hypothetical protein
MVTWLDVALGAGMIDGGLQKLGIAGEVHIALTPDDGERLEAAFHKHAKFSDVTPPGQVTQRTCTLSNVRFRWIKR